MKTLIHLINATLLSAVMLGYIVTHMPNPSLATPEDDFLTRAQSKIAVHAYKLDLKVSGWIARRDRAHVRHLRAALAGWLVVNGLLAVSGWFALRRSKDRISLEVSGGRVSVTVRALEDSLHRVLRQEPNIKDAKVTVIPRGRKVLVRAELTLVEVENLPALESGILDRMRHHFEVIFPSDEPVDYSVEIRKLRPSPKPIPAPIASVPAAAVVEPTEAPAPSPLPPNLVAERPRYGGSDEPQNSKES